MISIFLICVLTYYFNFNFALKTEVQTSTELHNALKNVNPGDEIVLKNGTYRGQFKIFINGTQSNPISLTGGRNAVLTNGEYAQAIYMNANYWILNGDY